MVSAAPAGDADGMTHANSTSLSSTRSLGITWLAVSAPVATVGVLLVGISEQALQRSAGLLLLVLAAVGVTLGAWVLSGAHRRARDASYAASLLWLVGAAVVYPTQDFAVDALWAAGLPLLGAVLTALVAWRAAPQAR